MGCILSWISVFLLYGFGELVDKTCSMEDLLKNEFAMRNGFYSNIPFQGEQAYVENAVSSNTIICPFFGTENTSEDYYCQKCKTTL